MSVKHACYKRRLKVFCILNEHLFFNKKLSCNQTSIATSKSLSVVKSTNKINNFDILDSRPTPD